MNQGSSPLINRSRLSKETRPPLFNVVNVYTKAAQYQELPAESSFRLQKVGGMIMGMVK